MGPRPALPREVAQYDAYQRQRLLVKPGITCYWQTRRDRDSICFDEWVDLDLWIESFDCCPGCRRCPSIFEIDRRLVHYAFQQAFSYFPFALESEIQVKDIFLRDVSIVRSA